MIRGQVQGIAVVVVKMVRPRAVQTKREVTDGEEVQGVCVGSEVVELW